MKEVEYRLQYRKHIIWKDLPIKFTSVKEAMQYRKDEEFLHQFNSLRLLRKTNEVLCYWGYNSNDKTFEAIND